MFYTKRQEKDNFKKDAFISDVCHRCLCAIFDQTEMAKEKEYLRHQEPMTRSRQLPYWAYVTAFLQTDLFLDYIFRKKKTKAVPVR